MSIKFSVFFLLLLSLILIASCTKVEGKLTTKPPIKPPHGLHLAKSICRRIRIAKARLRRLRKIARRFRIRCCKPVAEQKPCKKNYAPVCSVYEQQFSNACEAKRAGQEVACKGTCPCKKIVKPIKLEKPLKVKTSKKVDVSLKKKH